MRSFPALARRYHEPALDRELARDRLRQRGSTRVAGTNRTAASCESRISDQARRVSRSTAAGIARANGRGARVRCSRRRWRAARAGAFPIQHPARSPARSLRPTALESRASRWRGEPRDGWPLVDVMASPCARMSTFSAACDVHAPRCRPPVRAAPRARAVATGQHQRQRTGPIPGGEIRRVARQPQIELGQHVTARDEQEKGLSLWSALQMDQGVDRIPVDRATEAVDRSPWDRRVPDASSICSRAGRIAAATSASDQNGIASGAAAHSVNPTARPTCERSPGLRSP